MLSIAICDPAREGRAELRSFLEEYFAKTHYELKIKEYAGMESIVADYEEGNASFHLVFLDAAGPSGANGLEAARRIRVCDGGVPLAFFTADRSFAVESYDVHATGYLLKPLQTQKARTLLDRFLREEYDGRQRALLLRMGTRSVRIFPRDIRYIESRAKLLLIHTRDGREHRIYRKLGEMEQELKDCRFLRCHQSYIINMDEVSSMGEDFVLNDGAHIPIRRRGAKVLRERYLQYMREPQP